MRVKNRDLHAELRETFGFDEFLPGQEEILRALLDKRPAVRAEIEAVAARRIAETASEGQPAG